MPSLLGLVDSVADWSQTTIKTDNDSNHVSVPEQLSEEQIRNLWQTNASNLKDQPLVQEAHRLAWHAAWQSLSTLQLADKHPRSPEELHSQLQQALQHHGRTWLEPLSDVWNTSKAQLLAVDNWAELETAPPCPQGNREQGIDKPVLLFRARQLPAGLASNSQPDSLNDGVVDLLASNSSSQSHTDRHSMTHPSHITPANALANILRLDDDELNECEDHPYQDLLNTDGSLLQQLYQQQQLSGSYDGSGAEPGWHCLHDDDGGGGAPSSRAEKAIQALQAALSNHDNESVLESIRKLLGSASCDILPEDIITCSAWPDLCNCMTTTLTTAAAELQQLETQTVQLLVRLVVSLAAECCCTSPAHTVQLLQAIAVPLVSPVNVPDTLSSQLLLQSNISQVLVKECVPLLLLAAPALQLLQSIAHDWHLVECAQQEQLADVIINMLAAALLCDTTQAAALPLEEPCGISDAKATTTTCQLTAQHVMLSIDPHMQWLQRMLCGASSSQQFAHASYKPLDQSSLPPRRLSGPASQSLSDSAVNIHELVYKLLSNACPQQHLALQHLHQLGLLTCITCHLLYISEPRSPDFHNQQSPMTSTAVKTSDIVKLLLSVVHMEGVQQHAECISLWLQTMQHLLCNVAEQAPREWQASDIHGSIMHVLSTNSLSNQHQQQLIKLAVAICTSLSRTRQGCEALLSLPEGCRTNTPPLISVVQDLFSHPSRQTLPGCTFQLVDALITASHYAADMQVQLHYAIQLAQLLAKQFDLPVTSNRSSRQHTNSDALLSVLTPTQADALTALDKLLCAVPSLLVWLEQQPSALWRLLANHLIAQLGHEKQANNVRQSISTFDSCLRTQGVGGVSAISKRMQELLIRQGWIHRLLFGLLPFQLSPPSAYQQGLSMQASDLLQPHNMVYGGSSLCQTAVPAMSAIQATLSWHGLHDVLTASQQQEEFKGTEVLQALVSWLDVSPEAMASETEGADRTRRDSCAEILGTGNHIMRSGLSHGQARSIALLFLNTLAQNPRALRTLQDTTNVQWYLEHLIQSSLIPAQGSSTQPTLEALTCTSSGEPSSPSNHLIYDHDIQLATRVVQQLRQACSESKGSELLSSQQQDNPGVALPGSESAALPEVVKASAGMHDPSGWLDAASAAVQSDIHHGCGISIPTVGLLIQRTVLVAWPGICTLNPRSYSAQWACSTARTRQQPAKLALEHFQSMPTGSQETPLHIADSVISTLALLSDEQQPAWLDGHCSIPDLAAWLHTMCKLQGWAVGPGNTVWTGDAFLAVIGLLLGAGRSGTQSGSAKLGMEFLQAFMQSPASAYLWPLRSSSATGHNSRTALSTALCSSVQWVLCRSEPRIWAALGGQGSIGWTVVLHQIIDWLGFSSSPAPGPVSGLAWCGVLEGQQVVWALLLNLVCGPDYLVYCCVVAIKHCEEDIIKASQQGCLVDWLATKLKKSVTTCCWGPYASYMSDLCLQHRSCVLPALLDASANPLSAP